MKQIYLNGKPIKTKEKTVFALRDRLIPDGYAVVDGFTISSDMDLADEMSVCIFSKYDSPNRNEYEAIMNARNTPGLYARWRDSTVGIAGLGGLGSNVAIMLTRMGVGHFFIADFDTVDITNLNRQNYNEADIGSLKTEATARKMRRINPFVDVKYASVKLTPDNIPWLFKDCDVVVEALDAADQKLMAIDTLLTKTEEWVVSGNGLAGLGPSNDIKTFMPAERLVVCGDSVSEADPNNSLMSPRVLIAAAHQANAVARILAGLDPVKRPDRKPSSSRRQCRRHWPRGPPAFSL